MHPPAGIEFVTRRSRLNLRLRLIAAFAAGVLAVGCGAFVADPGYRATQLPDDLTKLFEVQQVVANPDADTVWIFEEGGPAHERPDPRSTAGTTLTRPRPGSGSAPERPELPQNHVWRCLARSPLTVPLHHVTTRFYRFHARLDSRGQGTETLWRYRPWTKMGYFHEAYIPAPAKISSRVSARSATAVACTSYSLTSSRSSASYKSEAIFSLAAAL